MKPSIKQYPAYVLFSYLLYTSIFGQTIASAIVLLGLVALSAYRLYLDKLELPDQSLAFKKEIDNLRGLVNQRDEDVKRMKEDFAKMSLSFSRGASNEKIRF